MNLDRASQDPAEEDSFDAAPPFSTSTLYGCFAQAIMPQTHRAPVLFAIESFVSIPIVLTLMDEILTVYIPSFQCRSTSIYGAALASWTVKEIAMQTKTKAIKLDRLEVGQCTLKLESHLRSPKTVAVK